MIFLGRLGVAPAVPAQGFAKRDMQVEAQRLIGVQRLQPVRISRRPNTVAEVRCGRIARVSRNGAGVLADEIWCHVVPQSGGQARVAARASLSWADIESVDLGQAAAAYGRMLSGLEVAGFRGSALPGVRYVSLKTGVLIRRYNASVG